MRALKLPCYVATCVLKDRAQHSSVSQVRQPLLLREVEGPPKEAGRCNKFMCVIMKKDELDQSEEHMHRQYSYALYEFSRHGISRKNLDVAWYRWVGGRFVEVQGKNAMSGPLVASSAATPNSFRLLPIDATAVHSGAA